MEAVGTFKFNDNYELITFFKWAKIMNSSPIASQTSTLSIFNITQTFKAYIHICWRRTHNFWNMYPSHIIRTQGSNNMFSMI